MADSQQQPQPALLPCPFCGGPAKLYPSVIQPYAGCDDLDCLASIISMPIFKWNRRVSSGEQPPQLDPDKNPILCARRHEAIQQYHDTPLAIALREATRAHWDEFKTGWVSAEIVQRLAKKGFSVHPGEQPTTPPTGGPEGFSERDQLAWLISTFDRSRDFPATIADAILGRGWRLGERSAQIPPTPSEAAQRAAAKRLGVLGDWETARARAVPDHWDIEGALEDAYAVDFPVLGEREPPAPPAGPWWYEAAGEIGERGHIWFVQLADDSQSALYVDTEPQAKAVCDALNREAASRSAPLVGEQGTTDG